MRFNSKFYQQSAWMIATTLAGGGLLYVVHIPLASHLPPGEYSIFATLLQVIHLLMIPTLALQIIFTEQTASAQTELDRQQLTAIVARVLTWFFGLWLLFTLVTFVAREPLARLMGVNHSMAFWTTMLTGWSLLWLPVLQGIMQGRENFKWLGWLGIINGCGRYLAVFLALVVFHGQIVAVMWAVWAGMMINLLVGIIQTRDIWKLKSARVKWGPWLRKVAPMTVGLGCSQIMFSADMVMVQSIYKTEPMLDLYGFAGTIARGLVILTTPLVGVLFPKVVENERNRVEHKHALRDALLSGIVLSVGAALVCSLFPEYLVKVLNKPRYEPAAQLIPLFCFAMIPLVFANLLLGYLLARRALRVVTWLAVITAAYLGWFVLMKRLYLGVELLTGFRYAILTVAVFNTLFFTALALFAWKANQKR